jgi:hypothetical protein
VSVFDCSRSFESPPVYLFGGQAGEFLQGAVREGKRKSYTLLMSHQEHGN